jgi:hypothetical protein
MCTLQVKEIDMKSLLAFIIAASLAFSSAAPSVRARSGATVIKRFECVIVPGDSGLPLVLISDKVSHEVDTASGNSILQCHFNIPKDFIPGRTLHHQGFLCATFLGLTTDSRSVTTRGGKVVLICRVKHN